MGVCRYYKAWFFSLMILFWGMGFSLSIFGGDLSLNYLALALKDIAQTVEVKKPKAPRPPRPPEIEIKVPSELISQEEWEMMTLERQSAYISDYLKKQGRLSYSDRMILNRRRSEVVAVILANTAHDLIATFSQSFDLVGTKISEKFPYLVNLADLIIHFDRVLGTIMDKNYLERLSTIRKKMRCMRMASNDLRAQAKAINTKTGREEFVCKALKCEKFDECIVSVIDDATVIFAPLVDVVVGGYRVGGREVSGVLEMVVGMVAPGAKIMKSMQSTASAIQEAITLLKNTRTMILTSSSGESNDE